MSDHAKKERVSEETAVNEAAQATAKATAAAEATASAEAQGGQGDYEVVVRLVKENEELKDRSLRGAAEMENLRRRTSRDVHDARSYAIANFARDMLSVSDNLR